MGTLTSWNPLGHSRPVMGLIYLYIYLKRTYSVQDKQKERRMKEEERRRKKKTA
jgi:hypothetical protein